MLLRLLNAYLLKGALFALIGVILFGVVGTEQIAGLLAVFIGIRLILLLIEAFQKPISEESWMERTAKLRVMTTLHSNVGLKMRRRQRALQAS